METVDWVQTLAEVAYIPYELMYKVKIENPLDHFSF